MFGLAQIGFTTPWLLWGLLALPVLWILLRAVPPAPIRRRFPGVILLLGLKDDDSVSDKTPWWLLLLRMLAAAALILGLAGPVLNPDQSKQAGNGPMVLVWDGSWAGAPAWEARRDLAAQMLSDAGRDGRLAVLLSLSDPRPVAFQPADRLVDQLDNIQPQPWAPSPASLARADAVLQAIEGGFQTLWFSDGLTYPGQNALLAQLETRGAVTVIEDTTPVYGLAPAGFEDGDIRLSALRSQPSGEVGQLIRALGRDPNGVERVLATVPLQFDDGALTATTLLSLPAELRARVSRFDMGRLRSAGGVSLSDDSLRRREVALITGRDNREGLELLSPLHYLQQALTPSADLLNGSIEDVLPANPDVIILADVAELTPVEDAALQTWVEAGGLLLRFAGPRLAASDVARRDEHPLLPVRLRSGGRTVGGAMSWGEPKTLAPFKETSPFYGLPVPEDVAISAQIMAQPDPSLADRVIAELSDGTPLVTRKSLGQGRVVLVHVSANAEWSSLPLSGLFVQMLDRLAVSSVTGRPELADVEGTVWQPQMVLDGFGRLQDASTLPGVAGEALIADPLGPQMLPGLYQGASRSYARNVITADTDLEAPVWPGSVTRLGLEPPNSLPLAGYVLGFGLILMLIDALATLALSGRLLLRSAAVVMLALPILSLAPEAMAQSLPQAASDDRLAALASSEVTLAYVLTGDPRLDEVSEAGLRGLSETLYFRTSVEPALPIGINLETDELALFPFLYWPITEDQPIPSVEAYGRLNTYLRSGGMILFDTRDANVAGFGAASPTGRKLRRLAEQLDVPALEPIPEDHVLTRTFYLLQDFPGRHTGRDIWVEAAPADAEQVEGMPFRNLNDGVTPVVIGGNDWAAAWAKDRRGNAMFPIGRGFSGERQRELAYRFGVNLVMHVLTGNYKSDQVHVPALLDRLGQ